MKLKKGTEVSVALASIYGIGLLILVGKLVIEFESTKLTTVLLGNIFPVAIVVSFFVFCIKIAWLRKFIPMIQIILSVPPIMQDPTHFSGVLMYMSGIIILFVTDDLKYRFALKVSLLVALLLLLLALSHILNGIDIWSSLGGLFVTAAFILIVGAALYEKLLIYIKKPMLRISEYKLSQAQTQTLRYLLQGKTTKDISGITGKKENTVQTHIKRAWEKMGLKDRMELIVFLERHEIDWGLEPASQAADIDDESDRPELIQVASGPS